MNNDISNKLKALRKHLGLTQGGFSEKINLKQSTYSMIENGNNNLSIDIMSDIIKAYNIDANYFFKEMSLTDEGDIIFNDNSIKYDFAALFSDYRDIMDNIADVAYMIDRTDSDYLDEEMFKQLLELDQYSIGVVFDILSNKVKQKDIELILSEKIGVARELLRQFIIDLHVLSIGGKVGSQAMSDLKDLYEQYLEKKNSF